MNAANPLLPLQGLCLSVQAFWQQPTLKYTSLTSLSLPIDFKIYLLLTLTTYQLHSSCLRACILFIRYFRKTLN